ncbi:MAG TPA: N-acetyl-gamma-glutamyl-phosphate reductase [Longimicrobiales bacterium]|nr:N-acetyl-gamma-glutamyl-phosphate reductase [Longimicrobiales bacterium]
MKNNRAKVGIIGGAGYTGQELVRLTYGHPRMELVWVTSESGAGKRVPGTALTFDPVASVDFGSVDLVFSCLPHGASGEWSLRARAAGPRVVDLSSDLRSGEGGAVYGLPELWREDVRGAELVGNPGCYPTGVQLGLAPALRASLVDTGRPIIVDAASGVTGAGLTPKREYMFGEVAEDYRAYGVGNAHRHVPEMARGLARAAGGEAPPFVFTPHLLPVRRGILETMYVPLRERIPADALASLYREHYADEPFVELFDGELPSLRHVNGRNVVAIGFADVNVDPPVVLVVAALDNLVKGAAGQALQNANLMLGFDEREGIPA